MKGRSCSTSSRGAPWVRVPPQLAFPPCPQDAPSHSLQTHQSHWPQLSAGPPCPCHQPLLWAGWQSLGTPVQHSLGNAGQLFGSVPLVKPRSFTKPVPVFETDYFVQIG